MGPTSLEECRFNALPAEVQSYLNPSRYCESDRLAKFAWNGFGALEPGHTRVSAIVDWVHDYLDLTRFHRHRDCFRSLGLYFLFSSEQEFCSRVLYLRLFRARDFTVF